MCSLDGKSFIINARALENSAQMTMDYDAMARWNCWCVLRSVVENWNHLFRLKICKQKGNWGDWRPQITEPQNPKPTRLNIWKVFAYAERFFCYPRPTTHKHIRAPSRAALQKPFITSSRTICSAARASSFLFWPFLFYMRWTLKCG